MKNLFTIATLLISSSTFAHVEPGTYVGETPDGEECMIEAIRQYYVDNVKHPLNERIELKTEQGIKFTVGHPPVIDETEGDEVAAFNHDYFEGILPTKTGAAALVINMKHEEGKEGRPVAFHIINHNWKEKKVSALHCEAIKLVD